MEILKWFQVRADHGVDQIRVSLRNDARFQSGSLLEKMPINKGNQVLDAAAAETTLSRA